MSESHKKIFESSTSCADLEQECTDPAFALNKRFLACFSKIMLLKGRQKALLQKKEGKKVSPHFIPSEPEYKRDGVWSILCSSYIWSMLLINKQVKVRRGTGVCKELAVVASAVSVR